MASQTGQNLPEVIRRYGEVAEMVNHREMKRFIAEVRSRWNPRPHGKAYEDYRFDGWTSEGALTKCIYDQAFYSHDRPQPREIPPDASDAEWNEQVQIKPSLDEIVDFVAKPLILPPLYDIHKREMLETIKIGLKQQVRASEVDSTALELPKDLEILFSLVKGINGAGVPAETAYTSLVYPFKGNIPPNIGGSFTKMPYDVNIRRKGWEPLDAPLRIVQPDRRVPIAALHLGGCEQHRSIYYVLTQLDNSTAITSDAKWQIWDRILIEIEQYEDLAEWLEHETKMIEENDGETMMRELVVMHERYPV